MTSASVFQCLQGCATYPLDQAVYTCGKCGGLLEVRHSEGFLRAHSPDTWRDLFASRTGGTPGPHGSGVWRFHEWVLPHVPAEHLVTLGEGASALTRVARLGDKWGIDLLIKQCGHSLSGSFKDLGMTVLISQVNHMRQSGRDVPAVACASTGDTSAALAAYGAAAGIRTLVLLPRGKVTAAQLIQPLAHGARVLAIDTDFDGCMGYVQRLAEEEGVYLANSKNSLRIEGQKTVALEIAQGLGWQTPDWVAIPGGNLGNVAALGRGFGNLQEANITSELPRLLCAQAERANPLYRSFIKDFAPLEAITAGDTQASAIRIGNPVSFPKAIAALKQSSGAVASITEGELSDIARVADTHGLYICPHTAVALAAVKKGVESGDIAKGQRVVVVATAHGLKFTEFKCAVAEDRVDGAMLGSRSVPHQVHDDYKAVRDAALL